MAMRRLSDSMVLEDDFVWLDAQRERCESALLEEICDALLNAGERDTDNTDEALAQLEAGTYGYCMDCHDKIPAERLEALTFAVRCVYCDRAR